MFVCVWGGAGYLIFWVWSPFGVCGVLGSYNVECWRYCVIEVKKGFSLCENCVT